MAERASFASQVASMDAQLKAMRSLVKQLEQARDATAIQHEKERSMLETQVLRLVQAVRKCREQLIKRRDQVGRLRAKFSQFRDRMLEYRDPLAMRGFNPGSLFFFGEQQCRGLRQLWHYPQE